MFSLYIKYEFAQYFYEVECEYHYYYFTQQLHSFIVGPELESIHNITQICVS